MVREILSGRLTMLLHLPLKVSKRVSTITSHYLAARQLGTRGRNNLNGGKPEKKQDANQSCGRHPRPQPGSFPDPVGWHKMRPWSTVYSCSKKRVTMPTCGRQTACDRSPISHFLKRKSQVSELRAFAEESFQERLAGMLRMGN